MKMTLFMVIVILAHVFQHASGVMVHEGEESVLLPCHVPAPLSEDEVIVWKRDDLNPAIVHILILEEDDLGDQNPRYSGRTSIQKDALRTGDLSLTLRNPTFSDSGTYTCTTRSFGQDRNTTEIQLLVTGHPPPVKVLLAVLVPLGLLVLFVSVFLGLVYHRMKKTAVCQLRAVEVTEGAESVLLPCESKRFKGQDVTVEWRRIQDNEMKVIVYERGRTQPQKNARSFRRRTEMKRDPQTTGDFSLTLRNPCFEDGGVYICTVYDKDGKTLKQRVVVLWVKEGWLKTIRGLCKSELKTTQGSMEIL